MLADAFYWLVSMSLIASFAGLIVMLLRVFRRLPRRVIAWLWAVPFLRATVPVGIGSRYSLMTILDRFAPKQVIVYNGGAFPGLSLANSVGAAETYFPITYRSDPIGRVFAVSSVVWAIGVCALLLTLTFLYLSTMREVRHATLLSGRVYASENVTSPAVYGVFRPKIVIPAAMANDENLRYDLLHEEAHIRRLDNARRILAFAAAAVHWFNPLSWLFLKCFLSDIEIACDESVLQTCNEDEKKSYAAALVAGAESKTLFASSFGGAKIRTRVERILSFRKMTALAGIAFAAMVFAIACVLLTNASP